MGKIRVKTLGDAEAEKQQKADAKKRNDAKKAEKAGLTPAASRENEVKRGVSDKSSNVDTKDVAISLQMIEKEKKSKKTKFSKQKHSNSYKSLAETVDPKKIYSVKEAIALLPQLKRAKFDETVEVHMNMTEPGVTVSTILPHGTGKKIRVLIANEAVIADIEKNIINFDLLVAEPMMMPKLAKVARILGPRGLMPNPKNGTVTTKPEEVAKKYAGGQVNYKTETKFPIMHISIGKVSFGEQKLTENFKAIVDALPAGKVRDTTLKLTMSPALHVDYTSI